MGSRLVWLCQLISLFFASSHSWRVKANHHQFPTSRYSFSLNAKQIKEDLKQRRQHARWSRPISLKPPPADWPQPPGFDGEAAPRPPAATVSPLLAYQARLEQELLEQQRKGRNANEPVTERSGESSEEILMDEDFKKLLDPDELLKHNKQLRPLVSKGGLKPLEIVKAAGKRRKKSAGTVGITSLTALKAKSSKRMARPTANVSLAAADVGETFAQQKSNKKLKHKSVKRESLKSKGPLSDQDLRKTTAKESLNEATLKTRRKKRRNFAFAKQFYVDEAINEAEVLDHPDDHGPKIHQTTTQSTATPTLVTKTAKTTTRTTAVKLFTTRRTSIINTTGAVQTFNNTNSSKIIENFNSNTPPTAKILVQGIKQQTLKTSEENFPKNNQTDAPILGSRRNEIREKRKHVKKQMEKVLNREQLEGSFSDKESDWKTSEVNRIHLLNVTPKNAIFSILRHKIIDAIDNIIRKDSEEY